MNLDFFVVGAFLLSAVVGMFTLPRIVLISKKKKLFDALSERKTHLGQIPRLGGIAFMPAFVFAFSFMTGVRYYYGTEVSSLFETGAFIEFLFLICGSMVLFLIGLADDLSGLSPRGKLLAQLLAAGVLLYAGVGITEMRGLLWLHSINPTIGGILSVLLIILITNAYNLIDGIDGLCSGLAMVALFTFGGWFWIHGIYIYAMMVSAMAGVVTVFFFFNIRGNRLKLFMGDTGSLMLGYLIAFLGLKFYDFNTGIPDHQIQAASAIFFGIVFIPVFDTLRVFFKRIITGRSPFFADKQHIHHKMLALGLNHIQSSLIIICIQVGFIILNFGLKNIDLNLLFGINLALGILLIFILNRFGKSRQKHLKAKKK